MQVSIDREILRLAIPNIISNITVPLLSMVDMAIVGHLSLDVYIGAIATATLIFNFIYWSFSFLRMGTSGFTAQAYGAEDKGEASAVLLRSLSIAFLAAIVIILLQRFIFEAAFFAINASDEVMIHARQYFDIYIWSAPFVLAMYALTGWFVGMQDARTPMLIAIATNVVNIGASLFFVYVLGMNIDGVALGSLIAQASGFALAVIIWFVKYKDIRLHMNLEKLKTLSAYLPFFRVNADIFIRTLLLIAVTTFFTSVSARMGNTILAANALLMQLFTLFSYMMDGFAYAAEALSGRFVGARQANRLSELINKLFVWGVGIVVFFTLTYALFTDEILGILTDKADVIAVCKEYKTWVLLIPAAGFAAFLWDGIFIGATASREMRNSMFIAAGSFFILYYLLNAYIGNNALWLSFITYLAMRGVIQSFMFKKIRRTISLQ